MAGAETRSANKSLASTTESGCAEVAALAADTLLFRRHVLLHVGRGSSVFAADLAPGGAGGFLFAEPGERLSKPQQRLRRFRAAVEFGGDGEERLGGIAIALALIEALAEPILRLRHAGIARILLQKDAQAVFRQCVVLALHITEGEIEFVARCRTGRRDAGQLCTAGGIRMARKRGRKRPLLVRQRGIAARLGQIKRSPGRAA